MENIPLPSANIEVFLGKIITLTINAWPLWLPVILGWIAFKIWMHYIQSDFRAKLEWNLLEIKIPREIFKGPKAMEVVLNMMHQPSSPNLIEKYLKGQVRPWFSLEIISIGGKVRFFVYTWKKFRRMVESQFYAQYPGIEITEADDYSKSAFIDGFGRDWNCWGTEFKSTADDDAYPIKTYIDYGLHELATKEEQKTDPITAFLEFLGALKVGEQAWIQILIKAVVDRDWKAKGKDLIKKILKEKEKTLPKIKTATGEMPPSAMLNLTPGERAIIEAVERDVSKLGFSVGIRGLYLARSDMFNPSNIASMNGSMKQYNALNLNGFKGSNSTSVDYPWQLKTYREPIMKLKMLDAYRQRSYFYAPYERKPMIMNTEELATIFHLPGGVAETPTLGRIEAKKSEPPASLPI